MYTVILSAPDKVLLTKTDLCFVGFGIDLKAAEV
jgi:hypothetical protein